MNELLPVGETFSRPYSRAENARMLPSSGQMFRRGATAKPKDSFDEGRAFIVVQLKEDARVKNGTSEAILTKAADQSRWVAVEKDAVPATILFKIGVPIAIMGLAVIVLAWAQASKNTMLAGSVMLAVGLCLVAAFVLQADGHSNQNA